MAGHKTAVYLSTAKGLTLALNDTLNEAKTLNKFKLPEGPVDQQTIQAEVQLRKIKNMVTLLETKLQPLQKLLEEWQNLLLTSTKVHEEDTQTYEQMTTDPTGLLQTINTVTQLTANLSFQQDDLNTMLQRLGRQSPSIALSPLPAAPPESPSTSVASLPKFHGGIAEFYEFWPLFETLVDNTNLPTIVKLSTLVQALTGQAKSIIRGYHLVPANYELIKEALNKEYNQPAEIRKNLRQELKNLRTTNRWEELKQYVTDVERILRQLANSGDDIESEFVQELITSKLPPETKMLLAQEKRVQVTWQTTQICEAIRNIIQMKRSAYGDSPVEIPQKRLPQYSHNGSAAPQAASNRFFQNRGFPSPAARTNNRRAGNFFSRATSNALQETPRRHTPLSTMGPSLRSPRSPCAFCGGNHLHAQCTTYQGVLQRRERAQIQRLCFKCLKQGHSAEACRLGPCPKCGGTHNSALCNRIITQGHAATTTHSRTTTSDEVRLENDQQSEERVTETVALTATVEGKPQEEAIETSRTPILWCPRLTVGNPQTGMKIHNLKVFIDPGSQGSFITRAAAERLRLPLSNPATITVKGIGGGGGTHYRTNFTNFELPLQDGSMLSIKALTLPNITDKFLQAAVTINEVAKLWHDKHAVLQVPLTEAEPDILLGMNVTDRINPKAVKQIPSGFTLFDSSVGLLIGGQGRVPPKYTTNTTASLPIIACPLAIEDLWTLDKIGINAEEEAIEDDEKALDIFQKTVTREQDGRYCVSLPWKTPNPKLASNFGLCIGRLQSTLRKLRDQPQLRDQYEAILEQQLADKIIERAPREPTGPLISYIPHQAVIRNDKTTTKVRIVFDASASVPKHHALNDYLFRGPVYLPDLVGLLLRFRKPTIVVIADLEKAFLQIGITSADRDVLRFLWVQDPGQPISETNRIIAYRFTRVMFGAICSPFLLAAVIRQHLNNDSSPWAKVIQENIYVDNVVLPAENEQQALDAVKSAKTIFTGAKMNLREFLSNNSSVNAMIPPENRHNDISTKVLGILWHTATDSLEFNTLDPPKERITKRTLLRFIAQHFDPIGVMSPAILPLKILLQKITKEEKEWDNPADSEGETEWRHILSKWSTAVYKIPRRIPQREIQLHIYTDASTRAYATSIYLRGNSGEGATCQLIFAKSRLCPIKKLTVPRLELLAITIGVRAANFVAQQLNICQIPKLLWSDSRCALAWVINNAEAQLPNGAIKEKLPRFIKNRLVEIHQTTDISYGHVPSEENPADLATRGVTPEGLKSNDLWWTGPHWLKQDVTHWPQSTKPTPTPSSEKEKTDPEEETVSEGTLITVAAIQGPPYTLLNPARFSTWTAAVHTTAWVFRFLQKIAPTKFTSKQYRASDGPLTAGEFNEGQRTLIRQIQSEITKSEIDKWNLIRDENGLWRTQGRLTIVQPHPIYMPRDNRLTALYILQVHKGLLHGGTSTTLAQIRRRFWIPQARSLVNRIIQHECHGCDRWKAKPFSLPKMPSLPECRVAVGRPFEITGVDYLGPLHAQTENGPRKRWIGLYTCFKTRAVHLETVENLSAEEFLHSYRRFISRRGCPEKLISDNATNFRLASKTLKLVQEKLAQNGTAWIFVTQLAPWKGGAYERMIALTKTALKRAVGKRLLQVNELETYTAEVEAVVNQRPLTPVHNDSFDILRPADFLTPNASLTTDPGNSVDDPNETAYCPPNMSTREALLEQWKKSCNTIEKFWKLWSSAYLNFLRERTQWLHNGPRAQTRREPKIGEVVMLADDHHPRSHWKLARIEHLPVSADNTVRTAKVRCVNGHLLSRPISLLYPLEVTDDIENTVNPTTPNRTDPHLEESEDEETTTEEMEPPRVYQTRSVTRRNQVHTAAHGSTCQLKSHLAFYMVILMLALPVTVHAMQVQICPRKHTGVFLKLPATTNCNLSTEHTWKRQNITLYRRRVVNIPAVYCTKIVRTICTWAFLRWSLQVVSDSTEVAPIKAGKCREIATTKHVDSLSLTTTTTPNVWRTQVPVSSSYNLFGTHCSPTTNYVIEYGSVALVSGSGTLSHHSRTANCHAADGQCYTPHETIVWNSTIFNSTCHYASMGIYEAHVSATEVIIDKLQATFPFTSGTAMILAPHCNISARMRATANNYIIVFGEIQREFSGSNPLFRTMLQEAAPTNDPENPKLQYLLSVEARKNALQWCKTANLFKRFIQQISIDDPTRAARILLGINVTARYIDDHMLVSACFKAKATKIYYNHQIGNKCFELLPVEIKGYQAFIKPIAHDVVPHSPEIACPWIAPRSIATKGFPDLLKEEEKDQVMFKAGRLPDLELEMIRLSLANDKPNINAIKTTARKQTSVLSAAQELVEELGIDVQEGEQQIEEGLQAIAKQWRIITTLIILGITTIVTVIVWLKCGCNISHLCCHRNRQRKPTINIRMTELLPKDGTEERHLNSAIQRPESTAMYIPLRLPPRRQ